MSLSRMTLLARSLFLLVAMSCLFNIRLVAQGPCDLYIQVEEDLSDGAAALDVAAFGSCEKPRTSAFARITLPDGTFTTGSGSGTTYAEAYTSAATNGEAGQGSFSGNGEAYDQCWELSDSSIPFNDPIHLEQQHAHHLRNQPQHVDDWADNFERHLDWTVLRDECPDFVVLAWERHLLFAFKLQRHPDCSEHHSRFGNTRW